MFPLGNNSDNVSLYLDYADIESAPANWSKCVQFALRMSNPQHPEAEAIRGAFSLLRHHLTP